MEQRLLLKAVMRGEGFELVQRALSKNGGYYAMRKRRKSNRRSVYA